MNTKDIWNYFKNQEFKKAIKKGEKLIASEKEFDFDLFKALGLAYDQEALNIKDKRKKTYYQNMAKKYFRLLIKKCPKSEAGYCGLGLVYLHQNKLSDAMKLYKKAFSLNSKNHSIYLSIGNVYRAQKKYRNAYDWYKKSMEDKNNELIAIANIALMHKGAGNLKLAKKYAKLFLEKSKNKKQEKWINLFKKKLEEITY